MAKSMNNKNTVSYEAKFLKKTFSKLSHQASPQKEETAINEESKSGGVKYSVEKKKSAHLPSVIGSTP